MAVLAATSTRARSGLRALCAASALGGLAQALAGTGGALLARQISGSTAVAGLPQTALVAGSAAAALALSALTRRHGRAVALATGAVLAVAGCIVVAAAAGAGRQPAARVREHRRDARPVRGGRPRPGQLPGASDGDGAGRDNGRRGRRPEPAGAGHRVGRRARAAPA